MHVIQAQIELWQNNMKIKNAIRFSRSHVFPWTIKSFNLSHKIGVPISHNIIITGISENSNNKHNYYCKDWFPWSNNHWSSNDTLAQICISHSWKSGNKPWTIKLIIIITVISIPYIRKSIAKVNYIQLTITSHYQNNSQEAMQISPRKWYITKIFLLYNPATFCKEPLICNTFWNSLENKTRK